MSGFFVRIAWLIPFFPLLGALIAAVGGRWLQAAGALCRSSPGSRWRSSSRSGLLVSAGPETTTVVVRLADVSDLRRPDRVPGRRPDHDDAVDGHVRLDRWWPIFAAGYMAGDPGYPRFFALIGLFVFSMTGLVLSNNYLLTYVFWEGVGVCSYLLVGFWHTRPAAAAAAMKAFLVNRIGDFGFAIAIFWLWAIVPEPRPELRQRPQRIDPARDLPDGGQGRDPAPALLGGDGQECPDPALRLAARRDGRPDAGLGPDPRRDDGHGGRLPDRPVDAADRPGARGPAPDRGRPAAPRPCLSASIALTQNDLKRVMAYSTVSQLGYMFMALGAGVGDVAQLAVVAAMFHLFTHAFFKALLFLASGSVMHAMGDVIDMRRFGGLRHRLPYTCWTFAVGGLALAGIFPLRRVLQQGRDPPGPEVGLARRAASRAGAGSTA